MVKFIFQVLLYSFDFRSADYYRTKLVLSFLHIDHVLEWLFLKDFLGQFLRAVL